MLPPEYVRRPAAASVAAGEQGRILLLALEGGQAFLARARDALERGDLRGFAGDLGRTQEVLLQLSKAIDPAQGDDVGASLGRLYEYVVGRLALANAERSIALVDEVQRAYAPIVDTYREIVSRIEASP